MSFIDTLLFPFYFFFVLSCFTEKTRGENDEKIIYQDYINCYDCWVRASFIPAAWDAEGNLTHVMLTDEGARGNRRQRQRSCGRIRPQLPAVLRCNFDGHDDARTIPILALTANAFSDDISKCRAAGMNTFPNR